MSELRLPRVNTVILSGRLTREVELRYTPGGTPVAKLSLAFDRVYRDNSGEWQQESSFLDIVVWSKRAEQCAQELHKGSPVLIEGYIRTRTYTDKDQNNRKITEIVASRVNFLEKQTSDMSSYSKQNTNTEFNKEEFATTTTDDDVPF